MGRLPVLPMLVLLKQLGTDGVVHRRKKFKEQVDRRVVAGGLEQDKSSSITRTHQRRQRGEHV